MSESTDSWDGGLVRTWLDRRTEASLAEQARADRNGRGHEDDYDKAAAEEWVCRAAGRGDAADDQKRFELVLKTLLAQDEYRRPGIHDDRRFEREVRACLRKVMKMTKTNTGFEKLSRFQ